MGTGGGSPAITGRRRSVSGVELSAKEAAAILQVAVVEADMPDFMQIHAFKCARRFYAAQVGRFSSKQLAFEIKKEFDESYGHTWHCIVGASFGSFVTHSRGCFIYFTMDKILLMLFMTRNIPKIVAPPL